MNLEEITKILTKDYHSIWVVDFRNDTMKLIRGSNDPKIEEAINYVSGTDSYGKAMEKYINRYVIPDRAAQMYEYTNKSKVIKHLERSGRYVFTYERFCPITGNVFWNSMNYVCVDGNDPGGESILCFSDVDDMIKYERDLIAEEERIVQLRRDMKVFDLIHESMDSGAWGMEFDASGNMIACNWRDSFRNMLGYTSVKDFPNEFSAWSDLLYEDDKERVLTEYWAAVKDYTGNTIFDTKYRLKTKNNGFHWFHAAGRFSRREDGSPITVVGLFVDIEEMMQNKLRLDSANKARDEQLRVLTTIADTYYSMHLIDLSDNTVEEYSADDTLKQFIKSDIGAIEMMKDTMSNVIAPEYRGRVLEFTDLTTIADRMKNKNILAGEFIGIHTGWFVARFTTVNADSEGKPIRLIFTTFPIDETKKKEELLRIRSTTDEMTGLFNRREYETDLDYYRTNAFEPDFKFLTVDVNRLKYVNDNFGHSVGDELLIGVAKYLKESFEEYGKLYRIGGDEFCAILHMSDETFRWEEKKFHKKLENWSRNNRYEITSSFGVVNAEDVTDMTIEDVIRLADKRMYETKKKFYIENGIDRRNN